MPSLEEAREQALREVEHWRTENRFLRQSLGEVEAARAEDEQRIAALVAVAVKVQRYWTHGEGVRFDIELELDAALRALAGQTENAE